MTIVKSTEILNSKILLYTRIYQQKIKTIYTICTTGRWPYCPFGPIIVHLSHNIVIGHTCSVVVEWCVPHDRWCVPHDRWCVPRLSIRWISLVRLRLRPRDDPFHPRTVGNVAAEVGLGAPSPMYPAAPIRRVIGVSRAPILS